MEFPKSHIHPPQTTHTHTVILLHGRGSDGGEFASELFSSETSNGKNLPSNLPSYRWVFPTSRNRWSTAFKEEMCAWFDAYSLDNIYEHQELQKAGLRESIANILSIIDDEARLLDGKYGNIYLGGMSQGMATALWAFLAASATGRFQGPLGGLLGFCGWLPFAQQLEWLLSEPELGPGSAQTRSLISGFYFEQIAGAGEVVPEGKVGGGAVLETPVFLSHGADDPWVSVELGRQACQVLRKIVGRVDWEEFTGCEGVPSSLPSSHPSKTCAGGKTERRRLRETCGFTMTVTPPNFADGNRSAT
ncbi:hypothetical protein DTO013E5_4028 [Penicillium roqueforti]|uniref:uncharacterized protein n=1 Tax=Penicillium roqueforti TaxID=5082 RepID=UPI00190E02E7|nr:uncharacterized protein LCP9604111_1541 [Penicillium roqueforti]KAF9251545.1 hypothetical protein LCP9604111_1541 [Penicillium roqueforti]KAI1836642.1 hypothetical protein CBS147337_2869 [Penicillium roqueforti]KAI2685219.1 hypothetical protein LCP963914a_4546 [Penicillium roqueforti]KAI2711677.1 hypothetical protein CBS147318_7955 [Penicillium roqueforti]KAI2748209.1 hypothetical protein DTO012A1_855 [Penicillium roqueforti]